MARPLHARQRRVAVALLGAALAFLALAALARAAPTVPAAAPILVSPPGGAYRGPDVALDAAGRALIVWQGEATAAPGSDIYGRLYGPDGHPLGEPFPVNEVAEGEQRRPAVAALPGLGFVVAWDTGARSVWARLLDPAGAPLGGGALAAPAPAAIQLNPALALTPGGALALVWEELDELTYSSALRLRRFDAAGAPAGEPVTVAEADAEELRDPVVSADAAGLLVAWAARDGDGNTRIVSRRLNGDSLAAASDALLAEAAGERVGPTIAHAADGSAVAAWAVSGRVEARLLDAAGAPAGEPFAPRPADAGPHTMLAVAAATGPAGSPLWVVWCESATSPQGGETESAIYARRYVERLYQLALPIVN